ncbi:MAG: trypsin-like peptidase domain-containing protein [Actinomycetota bacterium]|nr:trypsin-like peptidase domain-containing protein [Actinomycetota bacterium]
MDNNYNDENESIKPVFLKGCLIIIVSLVLIALGFFFTVGILSVINKTSPIELLRGNSSSAVSEDKTSGTTITENDSADTEKYLAELEEKKPVEDFSLKELNSAITALVEEVSPSVVNIRIRVLDNRNILTDAGVGSGVIYTEDGYIITNEHVIAGADEIVVMTFDDKEYKASLIGSNKDTDIAVIKIAASGLKEASFTSIKNVKVGEMVIAIGSPFAIEQTVTFGVVSAKGRDITISNDMLPMVDLIQTDTAINPGNSGGPLINISAQVIGINNLIFSPSGASAGIGFAIPSDTSVNIAKQIIKYGKARIPYIGIEMSTSQGEVPGVLISSVFPGYPAGKAGIRAGDVLTRFDGEEIKTSFELYAQMLRHNVDDNIEVEIYRSGKYITLPLILAESPVTADN